MSAKLLLLVEATEANLFGKSRKVQQEMDQAKADFEKAMDSKEDSKQARALGQRLDSEFVPPLIRFL